VAELVDLVVRAVVLKVVVFVLARRRTQRRTLSTVSASA
jgi:hypothetical protein